MSITATKLSADRPMRLAAYVDMSLVDLLERFARPDVDELLRRSLQSAAAHEGDHLLLRASSPEPLTDRSARIPLTWHAADPSGWIGEGVASLHLLVVRSGSQPQTELLVTLTVPDEVARLAADTVHRFLDELTQQLAA